LDNKVFDIIDARCSHEARSKYFAPHNPTVIHI